ncbi:MAG: hypothetical protein KY469_02915 [Actinobacteria bacterium]|nr:hypothetical protein [Actinomycetota bacterium]
MERFTAALPMLLVAAFALVVLLPAPARACSCALQTPAEALRTADAAVVGTVVDVAKGPGVGFDAAVTYALEVEAVLAGQLPERLEVHSSADSASCGLSATAGDRLGLLLYPGDAGWHGNLCSTYDADELLTAGPATAPTPLPPDDPDPGDERGVDGWLPLAGAITGSLAMFGALALWVRRRA